MSETVYTVYTADIGEAQIAALAAAPLARAHAHVRSLGPDIVLAEGALRILRYLFPNEDGFVDHRDNMWIGAACYPLVELPADHLFTVRVDGPDRRGAWDAVEVPHLVFGEGSAGDVAAEVASAEEDRPGPFRVLVWHGVGAHGEPAGIANVDDSGDRP